MIGPFDRDVVCVVMGNGNMESFCELFIDI